MFCWRNRAPTAGIVHVNGIRIDRSTVESSECYVTTSFQEQKQGTHLDDIDIMFRRRSHGDPAILQTRGAETSSLHAANMDDRLLRPGYEAWYQPRMETGLPTVNGQVSLGRTWFGIGSLAMHERNVFLK